MHFEHIDRCGRKWTKNDIGMKSWFLRHAPMALAMGQCTSSICNLFWQELQAVGGSARCWTARLTWTVRKCMIARRDWYGWIGSSRVSIHVRGFGATLPHVRLCFVPLLLLSRLRRQIRSRPSLLFEGGLHMRRIACGNVAVGLHMRSIDYISAWSFDELDIIQIIRAWSPQAWV